MVRCYEGNLGMGKTLNMVYDLMEKMKKGRVVISNTPIAFCTTNKKLVVCTSKTREHLERSQEHCFSNPCIFKGRHLAAKYFEEPKQFYDAFLHADHEIIAIDEAGIFFNRKFTKIPVSVFVKLVQSRKMGVDFYYTAQSFKMLESTFKTITNEVFQCRKRNFLIFYKLPKVQLFPWLFHKKKLIKYVDARIFTCRVVDPVFVIKNYSASKRGSGWMFIKYIRKLYPRQYRPAMHAFDTLKIVNMMPVGYRSYTKKSDEMTSDKPLDEVKIQPRLSTQPVVN